MKDYIAISREIKRRGEAKRAARRRRMHHALAACLLLCICIPVGFGMWQWASPAEAPSLPPSSEIAGDEEILQGDSKPPVSLPGEQPEQEEPDYSAEQDYSEEPWEEASEEPVCSDEPREEASEEPVCSEEPSDEEPGAESELPNGEPIPPSDPAMDAVELPDGTFLEILLFPIHGDPVEYYHKEAVGVIGVTVEGTWDSKQGYILITEGERLPNVEGAGSISRLETILEEADLEYPSWSLTVEEAEGLLFMLYLYYL